jgi:ATP-dependent Clp protease ATP-binding subunit ClpB
VISCFSGSFSEISRQTEVKTKEKTERALASFLRPEFINRIDEIITFRHLDKDDFVKIANIMLSKLKAHLSERSLDLIYDEEVLDLVAEKSYSEKYGARNMRRFIENNIEDKIASLIIDNYTSHISTVKLAASDGEITATVI